MQKVRLPWVEQYRPKTIKDCIVPSHVRKQVQSYVDTSDMQNLLFIGTPGNGKTSLAVALANDMGSDTLFLSASNVGIDVLRNQITDFASTVSLDGVDKHKIVILDDVPVTNSGLQGGLNTFIEKYASNCRFIMTTNFSQAILPSIDSRMVQIKFDIVGEDKADMMKQFYHRLLTILSCENVEVESGCEQHLMKFVAKHFPDCRKMINQLQAYVAGHGKIDDGILSIDSYAWMVTLVKMLKDKNFESMRSWLAQNPQVSGDDLFTAFYKKAHEYFIPISIPQLVLFLGEYQYKHAFVLNPIINMAAFLTEVMAECEFK